MSRRKTVTITHHLRNVALLFTVFLTFDIASVCAGGEESDHHPYFNETFDLPEDPEQCTFNPDKLSVLFNNDAMIKCSGEDLWEGSQVLSLALTSPPDDPFDLYTNVARTFCPLWLGKGRKCFQKYLIRHCTKYELRRSQQNHALNFIVSFNDAFCIEGPGKDAFFDLAKLGALECIKDTRNFQKPLIACLNRSDYMSDLLPIFLGYYQTCSMPLWKDCQHATDVDQRKFEKLLKILFKEMVLYRRIFWIELLK